MLPSVPICDWVTSHKKSRLFPRCVTDLVSVVITADALWGAVNQTLMADDLLCESSVLLDRLYVRSASL